VEDALSIKLGQVVGAVLMTIKFLKKQQPGRPFNQKQQPGSKKK